MSFLFGISAFYEISYVFMTPNEKNLLTPVTVASGGS